MSALPPTYFDFVKKIRPSIFEYIDKDLSYLNALKSKPVSIGSVDEFDSVFKKCINDYKESFIEKIEETLGSTRNHFSALDQQYFEQQIYSLLSTVNYEYHCLLNFGLAGKKVFYFSNDLSEHLANTEINQAANLLKLPYSTCLFCFTSPTVINCLHNIRGEIGKRAVNSSGEKIDYSAPISVFVTELESGEPKGRKLMIVALQAKSPSSVYIMLKRELFLKDGWSLEQALKTDWENIYDTEKQFGQGVSFDADGLKPVSDEVFYKDGLTFYRIVLNAILYLSSEKVDSATMQSPHTEIIKSAESKNSPRKKQKLLQSLNRYSELDYETVGGNVGKIVVQKEVAPSTDDERKINSPNTRFMVRGHWRNQAIGEERSERKLIWIKPYMKGPELADLINKPYIVK